jgi:hypothetical protein
VKTFLLALASFFICGFAYSQQSSCSTAEGIAHAETRSELALKALKERRCHREAKFDERLQATAKKLGWTKDDQLSFLTNLLALPELAVFENEKRPLMELLHEEDYRAKRGVAGDPTVTCEALARVTKILERIEEISDRQAKFELSQITNAR